MKKTALSIIVLGLIFSSASFASRDIHIKLRQKSASNLTFSVIHWKATDGKVTYNPAGLKNGFTSTMDSPGEPVTYIATVNLDYATLFAPSPGSMWIIISGNSNGHFKCNYDVNMSKTLYSSKYSVIAVGNNEKCSYSKSGSTVTFTYGG